MNEQLAQAIEEIERAKRISHKISPGPWSEDELYTRINDFDDSHFILYARNELLPNFIKMLSEAVAELSSTRK